HFEFELWCITLPFLVHSIQYLSLLLCLLYQVLDTSRTYPHAAFGHMDDEIRLGYQAGVVSLQSPTYGRLWLSVAHHPGDTVSCTQAEALVLAAEACTRLQPRRRTELLRQRLQAFEQQVAQTSDGK